MTTLADVSSSPAQPAPTANTRSELEERLGQETVALLELAKILRARDLTHGEWADLAQRLVRVEQWRTALRDVQGRGGRCRTP